jgi:hypothetical protein
LAFIVATTGVEPAPVSAGCAFVEDGAVAGAAAAAEGLPNVIARIFGTATTAAPPIATTATTANEPLQNAGVASEIYDMLLHLNHSAIPSTL